MEDMKVRDYKDLRIWQKGIEIVDEVYAVTDSFPKDEMYGLTSQMRRAAVSIPANIAEGFARRHTKEYSQFISVSLGSCAELDTQLIIAHRRNYLNDEKLKELSDVINHEARMLATLIKKLKQVTSHE